MGINVILSTITTIGGLVVERLKSRDRFDEKNVDKLEPKFGSCKLPKNRFRATPDLINALKEDKSDDDLMFKMMLISIMENA